MKRKPSYLLAAWPKALCLLLISLMLALATSSALATDGSSLSPTTGLPTENPYWPILVIISNSEQARPAWGLSEADIVYESIFWGPGHTRYLALFNDNHPAVAGAIRSSRVHEFEWREEWDCPFIFGGGPDEEGISIYTFIQDRQVDSSLLFNAVHSGPGDKIFSERTDREPPHNRVVDLGLAVEDFWPTNSDSEEPFTPRLPNWRFSEAPTRSDETAMRVEINYLGDEDYHATYTFNEEKRVFERWYNGKEEYDYGNGIGKRIVASNIIVQYCNLTYFKDQASRPVLTTTGGGPIEAFIDGRRVSGTWSRPDLDSQTEYLDENGDPLILLPGKTFIQVVPPGLEILYVDADGVTQRAGT